MLHLLPVKHGFGSTEKYAGHRPYLEAYISPSSIDMDITEFVKYGEKNTIAVLVSTGLSPAQATDGFLGRLFLYSPLKQ